MSDYQVLLDRYADVVVRVGANVQPGQYVVVEADVAVMPLVRAVTRSAYEAGASYVDVWLNDEQLALARFRHAPRDTFEFYPHWPAETLRALADDGAALIWLTSSDPDLLRDQPADLVATVQRVEAKHYQPVLEQIGKGVTNWTGAGAASPGWAARVFPELPQAVREARLWEAIFATCRLGDADPVASWRDHVARLAGRAAQLNARRYDALHYRAPGTDLVIGLPPGHRWCSGALQTRGGLSFVANLPTEEVFTLPDARRVDGVVQASRPLNLGGTLVEDFSLTFSGGRVVQATAARGQELLDELLRTDDGAARLGEVALLPNSSPIARSGLLFYNTLFDENAACHLALGMALRFTLDGADALDDEAFRAAGGNLSATHVDFMVGSGQLDIDGISAAGDREPLMRRGEWAWG